MRFVHSSIAAIVATIVTIGSASCGTETCHLIGCDSGLSITAPWLTDESFSVDVQSPSYVGSFTCPALEQGAPRQGAAEAAGDFVPGEERAVAPSCLDRGFSILRYSREAPISTIAPASAMFVVRQSGEEYSLTLESIEYSTRHPNGPDCPPTCVMASVEWDAPQSE